MLSKSRFLGAGRMRDSIFGTKLTKNGDDITKTNVMKKNNRKLLHEFKKFLTEHCVLTNFVRERMHDMEHDANEIFYYVDEVLEYLDDPEVAIQEAFDWAASHEGYWFWNDVDDRWLEYIKERGVRVSQ